jgi:hypothetical protein
MLNREWGFTHSHLLISSLLLNKNHCSPPGEWEGDQQESKPEDLPDLPGKPG